MIDVEVVLSELDVGTGFINGLPRQVDGTMFAYSPSLTLRPSKRTSDLF
jgi:hypothetical protein